MGNRAVITTKENMYNNGVAIYLHWNGGRDSVEAFLEYGKLKGLHMDDYGFARLTQIISNFFGGTLSIGVNVFNHTDYDNMDNGTYIVDNDLNIIERRFAPMFEQNTYNRIDMLLEIDRKQPQNERFGKDFLTSELVKANELKIGDTVFLACYNEPPKPHTVIGYGRNRYVHGLHTNGIPYTNMYNNMIPEDNVNNYVARHLDDLVRVKRA